MHSDGIGVGLVLGAVAGWFLSDRMHRMVRGAARDVSEAAQAWSSRFLEASEREGKVAANVQAVSEGVNVLEQSVQGKLTRLADVIDSLDRNQGAILSGLINSGVMKFADPVAPGKQVGEEPLSNLFTSRTDRVPPLGEDDPLV